jgi:4a-hydroxytetrahydrobiopterin dehydratase|tara:strand:+ start:4552 stop:4956 length:405 start_codon:yes stop_codon:yes gene_type:complete
MGLFMKLNELMREYLSDSRPQTNPLKDVVPLDLICESTSVPVQAVEVTWVVEEGPERLVRTFSFPDLSTRNWFVSEIMEKEKETEHHGKILIEGNDVKIEVQTHDLNRVTELDQEYAAYCDDVFGDVGFMRELF